MKKIFALMTAVMLAAFAYTSCGDDDDENTENPEVKDVDVFANFMASPSMQYAPSTDVNLYAVKVAADGVRYAWDFGDGTNAIWNDNSEYQEKLVHTYKESGEYTITLTVTGKDGKIETAKQTVTILPVKEGKTTDNNLFIVSPQIQEQPSMIVNIYSEQVEDENAVYTWTFGDGYGTQWYGSSDYMTTLVHTYETWGDYTITLVVRSMNGIKRDTLTRSIKILPAQPTNIQVPTKYEGVAKFTLFLEPGVMYYDFVKWDIKSVKDGKETTVDMFYVKADEQKAFTFDNPGDYLLHLTAYGDGAPDGKEIRTDTVKVWSDKDYPY